MSNIGKYEWSENYLLNQGYNKDDINKFFHINNSLINEVKEGLLAKITKNKKRENKCLFLFGQPGCGKSTYMRNNNFEDYVILDIDDFRLDYPFKDDLVKTIEDNHQRNKNLPSENTKGRDFTNFTREFIGVLLDNLLEDCVSIGYNIALQKHATDYKVFENTFKKLIDKNYEINIVLILVKSSISWQRCQNRNKINDMTLNTVAKDFHDSYVEKIPQTIIDVIENYIFNKSYVSKLTIVEEKEDKIIDINSEVDYEFIKKYISNGLQFNN